ncbi:MAG: hypothetical protein ACTTK0_02955 [Stomatobaculum sp.]
MKNSKKLFGIMLKMRREERQCREKRGGEKINKEHERDIPEAC